MAGSVANRMWQLGYVRCSVAANSFGTKQRDNTLFYTPLASRLALPLPVWRTGYDRMVSETGDTIQNRTNREQDIIQRILLYTIDW